VHLIFTDVFLLLDKSTMRNAAVLTIFFIGLGFRPEAQNRPFTSDPAAPTIEVKIVQGPVVENVTDSTAIIAWSTNVSAGTVLHYGIDPTNLDQAAGMPWGGLTHRVTLKDLKPDTKYYFRAESAEGQGTGTSASAPQSSFRTKAAATCTGLCA
jgi:Purple acid Phosphatase, N-terminal domain